MYRYCLALLLSWGLVAAVPAQDAQPRIVGGQDVTQMRPWMVEVEYSRSGNPEYTSTRCGGTLIAPGWVLTAAHCVVIDGSTLAAQTLFAALGQRDRHETPAERLAVASVLVHSLYDANNFQHDLALLRLATPSTASPVNLATADQMRSLSAGPADDVLLAMGWGEIASGEMADRLQEVALDYVPLSACERHWGNLTVNQLCAGEMNPINGRYQDTCRGDSGGPLLYREQGRYWLVGVVSYGHSDCGKSAVPAVYSQVARYLGWLEASTGLELAALQVRASLDRQYLFPGEVATLTARVHNRSILNGIKATGVRVFHRAGIVIASDNLQCQPYRGYSDCWRDELLVKGQTSNAMQLTLQHQGAERWHDTLRIAPLSDRHNYHHLEIEELLVFSHEPHLAVALNAKPVGDDVLLAITVDNLAEHQRASRVRLQINLPTGWNMSLPEYCAGSSRVVCELGDMATASSRAEQLRISGSGAGTLSVQVDADNGNYPAAGVVRTVPAQARTVVGEPESSGGGGGGASLFWLLLLLAGPLRATLRRIPDQCQRAA